MSRVGLGLLEGGGALGVGEEGVEPAQALGLAARDDGLRLGRVVAELRQRRDVEAAVG